MKKPYLIQRARFQNNPSKTGIDQILSFDYMGCSEFKWGALPSSLKRVRENISDYVQFQYSFTKYPLKVVTLFCKKEHENFVGDILEELNESKIRLKSYCDLTGWVNPREFNSNRSDFWWDIEQDWFFWKFNPEFDAKFIDKLKKIN